MGLSVVSSTDVVPVPADVTILPTTIAHVRELARTMRAADRREIEIYGISSDEGLYRSFRKSLATKTAVIEARVAAIWGVGGNYLGDIGTPWLLTSEVVHLISPLRFARIYQQEVYEMLEIFDTLENYVDSAYPEAIRLLSIIGFTIGAPEKVGNAVYRKFSLAKGNI